MGKYPIYAIVAFIFIGIIKLLQVTVFDAEKYNKNKKVGFSKGGDQVETTAKSEGEDKKASLSESVSETSEKTPPPVLEREEKSEDTVTTKQKDESFQSQPVENKAEVSYKDLNDLKNLYLAPKIASLPPGQLREDVVIRYYRHDEDGDKVYALKELGYYIHEKEATETAGVGSNILYYGSDVAREDIQIVAYTLLERGLPIKAIEPTRFTWKSNSIEIGTDTLLQEDVTLSKSDIKNFRN